MKCPNCGVKNKDGSKQCIRCGTLFDNEAEKDRKERNQLKEKGKNIIFPEALEYYVGDDYRKVVMNHNYKLFFIGFLWFYEKGYRKAAILCEAVELFSFLICYYYGKFYGITFFLFGLFYLTFGCTIYLNWAKKNVSVLQKEYEKSEMTDEAYIALLKSPKTDRHWILPCLNIVLFYAIVALLMGRHYFDNRYAQIIAPGWYNTRDAFVYKENDVTCEMKFYHTRNEKEYQRKMEEYNLLTEDGKVRPSSLKKLKNKSARVYNTVVDGKDYLILIRLRNPNTREGDFFIFYDKENDDNNDCYDAQLQAIKNIEIKTNE